MNYLMVDLYKEFQCSADACPNTCCKDWKIIIDEVAYEKMAGNQEQLGIPAEDWIKKDKERGYVVKLDAGGRCPMLNDQNLCKVVLNLGPEYLSSTCTIYPRSVQTYGDVMEGFLYLSCPEVVLRLMERREVQFDLASDDNPASPFKYESLYRFAAGARSAMVDILQFPADISLVTRLFAAYDILERAVRLYEEKRMDFSLLQMEADRYFQEDSLYFLDNSLSKGMDEENRFRFLAGILSASYNDDSHLHNCYVNALNYFAYGSPQQYGKDMEKFRRHLKQYQNFYINYWIYHIFEIAVKIPDYSKAKERFIYAAAEFCIIQCLAFVQFTNNGILDRDDYVNMISSVIRITEHDNSVYTELMKRLNALNAVGAGGLLMMIIS